MSTLPHLTPRLKKIADLIQPCNIMADIGTDHAYLPVYLCMSGKCKSAIASDIKQGPLESAASTVTGYNQAHKIELRLGSGVDTLEPEEADVIVIAGMGGIIITEILKSRPEIFKTAKQILIQPMSSVSELRENLCDIGYEISNEYLAKEDRKIYNIMTVTPCDNTSPQTEADIYVGKKLMENRPEHFDEYIIMKKKQLENMIEGLKKSATSETSVKLQAAKKLLKDIETRCNLC